MSARWVRLIVVPNLTLFWAMLPFAALAQGTNAEEQIPPLRPPKPELPPGWWEQNGFWVLAAVVVLLTLSAAIGLICLRLKKTVVAEPARRAHQELEPLVGKPEDGLVLTRASQAVKGYYQSAFSLAQGELTTTEFCNVVNADTHIGRELGSALQDFLRRCDQRKFAPVTPPEPLNAARTALNLVDTGEQRRLELVQQNGRAEQG